MSHPTELASYYIRNFLTRCSEKTVNTGEIKAARKETGHPTSHADGSEEVYFPAGTPHTYESVPDYLYLYKSCKLKK